jgi:hypothetical protein
MRQLTKLLICILAALSLTACNRPPKNVKWHKNLGAAKCGINKDLFFRRAKLTLSITGNGKLYFIQNTSRQTVLLNHTPKGSPGASAGWSSTLKPNNWSAIALDKGNFSLSCSVERKNGYEVMPCEIFLAACRVYNAKMPKEENYWLTEDQPQAKLLQAVKARKVSFYSFDS